MSSDYLVACELLGEALDEYGDGPVPHPDPDQLEVTVR